MRDRGEVQALERSLYRLADAEPLGHADWEIVAAKNARVPTQIDVAFGDVVTPRPATRSCSSSKPRALQR